jgi:U6 snRNA-associated Sm-like protein LSm1
MSDKLLNTLLKNVIKSSGQQQQTSDQPVEHLPQTLPQVDLPKLPPNVKPLTEKELQELFFSDQSAPKNSSTSNTQLQQQQQQHQQQQQKQKTSSTSSYLDSIPIPVLSEIPLPNSISSTTNKTVANPDKSKTNNQEEILNDFENLSILNSLNDSVTSNSNTTNSYASGNFRDNNSSYNNNSGNQNLFKIGTNIDINPIRFNNMNNSRSFNNRSFNDSINNSNCSFVDIYSAEANGMYMPGTASLIKDVDKQLMVILRDGKMLIGYLRSIDQFANLLLSNTIERVCVENKYGDIPKGVYLVRGENVVLIGEVDNTIPHKHDTIKVSVEEILELQKNEQKKQQDLEKNKKKALLNRCFLPQSDSIFDDYY